MKMLLLIGCAGFAGTLLRWGSMRLVTLFCPNFPWGTLAVNITGAFAAGFCFILCRTKFPAHEANFPILFAGFFGAFITFSTFALESATFKRLGSEKNLKDPVLLVIQKITQSASFP